MPVSGGVLSPSSQAQAPVWPDPIALDVWATETILMPTAEALGYGVEGLELSLLRPLSVIYVQKGKLVGGLRPTLNMRITLHFPERHGCCNGAVESSAHQNDRGHRAI